jgi:hypothetical protein
MDTEGRKDEKKKAVEDEGATVCVCLYQNRVPWRYWNFQLLLPWTNWLKRKEPFLKFEEEKLEALSYRVLSGLLSLAAS